MEKWCILPDNLIQDIAREDNIVLRSLARFCDCTEEQLIRVLKMRNKKTHLPYEVLTPSFGGLHSYGYEKYWKTSWKKKRLISIPNNDLKKIQEMIKERLSYIPVSLACTGGKPWDSAQKNAEMHRYNPYMIAIDIKNAYPSIDTHRVYKNLQWALAKPLKIWCPLLEKDEDKDLFVKAITHLCVSENQLPQWASTSTQIQNIVMAWFDPKIEKKLPELQGAKMVYSRYADDITVSFPHFSTKSVLEEKLWKYASDFFINPYPTPQEDPPTAEKLRTLVENFAKETFILSDDFEFKFLQEKIKEIEEYIEGREYDRWIISKEEKYAYIGIIHKYKQQIKYSGRRIADVADEIIEVIGNEWRKINFRKYNTRTPQSNTDREINGMTFDSRGNRGIDKRKKARYMRLLDDLTSMSIDELRNSEFYKYKLKLNVIFENEDGGLSIYATHAKNIINGVYNYIASIYGKDDFDNSRIPKDLSAALHAAKEKREDYVAREEKNPKKRRKKDDDLPFL